MKRTTKGEEGGGTWRRQSKVWWEEGHGEDNQRCGGRRDKGRTTKGVEGEVNQKWGGRMSQELLTNVQLEIFFFNLPFYR